MTMTLILEIAAGIVLGVAIVAVIAVCWEQLLVGLMFLLGLAVTAVGIVVLYSICGSWGNVALAVLGLGIICAVISLANFFKSHEEKYGPSFRAMGNTVGLAIIVATFTSIILGIPFSILAGNWIGSDAQPYLIILPGLVVSAFSARFFYRYALRKELSAASEKSA
jgi:hypothetical protein